MLDFQYPMELLLGIDLPWYTLPNTYLVYWFIRCKIFTSQITVDASMKKSNFDMISYFIGFLKNEWYEKTMWRRCWYLHTGRNDVSINDVSLKEMKHFLSVVIAWLRAHGLFSLYPALRMFGDGSKTKKSAKSS